MKSCLSVRSASAWNLFAAVCLLLLPAAAPAIAQASSAVAQSPALPRYTIMALDPLPKETMSQALALNDSGIVVGWSGSPGRPNYATVWKNGVPTLPRNTQYYTIAEGVNAAGVVVGSPTIMTGMHMSSTLSGASALSIWADKTDYLPGFSNAHAINDVGQLAGDVGEQAALWYAANRFLFQWHRLNAYPGYAGSAVSHLNAMSTAYAVNSGGQAAGVLWSSHTFSLEVNNFRAFRIEDGKIALLETPKGGSSAAFALSDDGTAVGLLSVPGTPERAVLWPAHGAVQPLPTLPGLPHAAVFGVNNAGLAVGSASRAPLPVGYFMFTEDARPDDRAVLWRGGAAVDLTACLPSSSGWTLQAAHAVNRAGQIVGFGLLNGQTRAFLLTPTP